MKFPKKLTGIFLLAAFVVAGTAASVITKPPFKNLKVLPPDISEHALDSIMHSYNIALKVSCDFCHNPAPVNFPLTPASGGGLDFAADNGMKENARQMIRMNREINSKYFNFDSTRKPELINVITCNTCHRGNPYPANE